MGQMEFEIPPRPAGILSDQPRVARFVDRDLQRLALADKLAANVDVSDMGTHRETGNKAAFDKRMRVVAHDLAILACAWFRLIGVHHEIGRSPVAAFGHERPFQAGWKTCPAAAPADPTP